MSREAALLEHIKVVLGIHAGNLSAEEIDIQASQLALGERPEPVAHEVAAALFAEAQRDVGAALTIDEGLNRVRNETNWYGYTASA